MRRIAPLLVLLASALPVGAQDMPPSGLQALEVARTSRCVDALTRLEALDAQLEPFANRGQRLLGIAGAIRVEEFSIVDSLDTSDPLEAAVVQWFRADAALAERYLTDQSQTLLDERTAGRRAIQQRVTEALQAVQDGADSVAAPTGNLQAEAVACSGAILVRGTAVEACEGLTSRVCQAALDRELASPFRFVESTDVLWYRQELTPWTASTPLQVSPERQIVGARTVGSSRTGNVVVSIAFSPMLRAREELDPEEIALFDSINSVLGIEASHPQITFAPALSIQATLPRPLDNETDYLLHFGTPDSPEIVWAGVANTGATLVGTMVMAPVHVARLRAGDPLTLTAVREDASGEVEGIYTLELTSINQVGRVEALLRYMSGQLSADLVRLIPPVATEPGTGDGPPA